MSMGKLEYHENKIIASEDHYMLISYSVYTILARIIYNNMFTLN